MQWKCLKCGNKVSVWASVCPYCHRNPGGPVEHFFMFCAKLTILFVIIMVILQVLGILK